MKSTRDPIPEAVYDAIARFEHAVCDLDATLRRHKKPLGEHPHAILNTALETIVDAAGDVRTAHDRRADLRLVPASART